MRQALERMATLHAALTAEPESAGLDLSEGASPRRFLELLRRGLLDSEAYAQYLQRLATSARESAQRMEAMALPADRDGLMARIMITSREAAADVVTYAGRLRDAGIAGRWDDADTALSHLEDAQMFLQRIGKG